ncbi:MAG TPA: hypothetical protein VMY37_08375, partial [Thermoguttaceae bacterium]|nr:hypothetical protein [Thermoguttaceae bacterium]
LRFGLQADLDPIYKIGAAAERERCKTIVLLGDVLTRFVVPAAIPASQTWQRLLEPGRYLRYLARNFVVWWVPGTSDSFMAMRPFRIAAKPVRVAKHSTLLLPTDGAPNILFSSRPPRLDEQAGPPVVRGLLRWLAKADPSVDVREAAGAARIRERAREAAKGIPLIAVVHTGAFPYAGVFDDIVAASVVSPELAVAVQPDGCYDCRIVKL